MRFLLFALIAVAAASAVGWFLLTRNRGTVDQSKRATRDGARDQRRRARLGYEDSCTTLQRLGYLDAGALPPLPDHRPRFDDDEPLGVNFFRTSVSDESLDNLTLPRTFFGKSEIKKTSFVGTDLSESTLCWNDFVEVDFTGCDLARSDLRASLFKKVKFVGANLQSADLRRSTFEDCDFKGASTQRAGLTQPQRRQMRLSDQQIDEIDWQSTDGDEPGGG